MKKYTTVFTISLAQEFAYRMNFIMWRVRNIVQMLVIYFLWDTVFADPATTLFGYDRVKMMTYVFGVLILRAIITSMRSVDVPGEIARGDLVNYLLKPVSFFRYWLSRDLASKALNVNFSLGEGIILYLLLRPPIYIPSSFITLVLFIFSVLAALSLYFLLVMSFATLTFWMVEQAWGVMFLLIVFTDLLGGIVFPIDILPVLVQKIIYATPFPYLIFMPIQIYLEKLTMAQAIQSLGISTFWIVILGLILKKLWNTGVSQFRAEGR